MTLRELLQDYVNLPYDQLVKKATNYLNELMPTFIKYSSDGNGADFAVAFIFCSIASDGKLTDTEYNFLNDVFHANHVYDSVKLKIAQYYNQGIMELMDNIIDSSPKQVKNKILHLCACFLAVDETVTREEIGFITKLLA